jgi:aldehyde dehydrogenase family 7 protein A1
MQIGIQPTLRVSFKFAGQFERIFLNQTRKMNSTSLLINRPKYSFLKELGITEQNIGVFDGTWKASGNLIDSVNPATNEPIAKVSQQYLYFNNFIYFFEIIGSIW